MVGMKARLKALHETRVWTFASRLYHRFQNARITILAAALAFYAAFSVGPLLLLLAGGVVFLLQRRADLALQVQNAIATLLAQILPLEEPEGRTALIEQSFEAVLILLQEGAVLRSVLSLLVLVWASSNFFTSLQLALELIFASEQPRALWRKRLIAILIIPAVGVIIFFEVVTGFFLSYVSQLLNVFSLFLDYVNAPYRPDLPEITGELGGFIRLVLAAVVFVLCFRYLPRRSSSWVGAGVGALFSTLSIWGVRELLRLTFNLERFNLIYGVITSLLFMLMWLYLAILLFLLGALLAAEISSQRRKARNKPVTATEHP